MIKLPNIEEKEVKSIIAELENSGAIIKYCALVNEEIIDKQRITAIIEVKIRPVGFIREKREFIEVG